MAPRKVRLDLMVNEGTKEFLQSFAREQGISMSEMVDRLIVEHLMNESWEEAPRGSHEATIDALRIDELKEEVNDAISEGAICSFEQYCAQATTGDSVHPASLVYAPSKWPHLGLIVADMCVDEQHDDIISTYGGDSHGSMLNTVDAYLSWYEDTDGYHINGLCITPKGKGPQHTDCYDWSSPATWPDDVPEPQCD